MARAQFLHPEQFRIFMGEAYRLSSDLSKSSRRIALTVAGIGDKRWNGSSLCRLYPRFNRVAAVQKLIRWASLLYETTAAGKVRKPRQDVLRAFEVAIGKTRPRYRGKRITETDRLCIATLLWVHEHRRREAQYPRQYHRVDSTPHRTERSDVGLPQVYVPGYGHVIIGY